MGLFKNSIKLIFLISTIGIFSTTAFADTAQLTEYAGSGSPAYNDDTRAKASFNQPYGLALDKDGGIIVVDSLNNRIREIKGDAVTTIAGFSDRVDNFGFPKGGFVDGDALKAKFNKPRGAVVDSKGNIFVTDTGNNAIRKITTSGKVYTFAGKDMGYADGKGITAKFNSPSGITIDASDNLYIADSLNHVVRKITPTGDVTTFAGMNATDGAYLDGSAASARFNEPSDVKLAKDGSLYVLDCGNQLIRKITNGTVTTVSGSKGILMAGTTYLTGGFADGSAAKYNFPKGMFIADNGTIFIADTWNQKIRALKPDGNVITVVGMGISGRQGGSLSNAELNAPVSVLYNAGTLYFSDSWNNCIRSISFSLDNIPRSVDMADLISGITFDPLSDKVQVWIDKKKVDFPDVQPYIDASGSTYVPIRYICSKWGADVTWVDSTKQVNVTKGAYSRELTFGKDPIVNKDDRTVIGVRNLAESMGFYVDYIPEYRAVVISTGQ